MSDQLDWVTMLEEARGPYLDRARDAARNLLSDRESITINDVRSICPPPSDIDPRVMGAVFRHRDFEATGEFVLSSRETCHRRPIQKFTLSSHYRVHEALRRAA